MAHKETVEEIKQRTGGKFTDDEINTFINTSSIVASKPVLSALIEVIKEGPTRGFDKDECDTLVERVTKTLEYSYAGYIDISFDETPMKLHVCLTLSERDYKNEVMVPDKKYVNEVYETYNSIKKIAQAYWFKYIEKHPELIKRISHYRNDVDFTGLKIDAANPTTLYFDSLCAKRISVLTYYVDENGQPFYKKTNTEKESKQ